MHRPAAADPRTATEQSRRRGFALRREAPATHSGFTDSQLVLRSWYFVISQRLSGPQ